VVAGVIEILFIDRSVTLNAGDVIHFSGDLKHQIHKLGAAAAVALVIVANDLADTRKWAGESMRRNEHYIPPCFL